MFDDNALDKVGKRMQDFEARMNEFGNNVNISFASKLIDGMTKSDKVAAQLQERIDGIVKRYEQLAVAQSKISREQYRQYTLQESLGAAYDDVTQILNKRITLLEKEKALVERKQKAELDHLGKIHDSYDAYLQAASIRADIEGSAEGWLEKQHNIFQKMNDVQAEMYVAGKKHETNLKKITDELTKQKDAVRSIVLLKKEEYKITRSAKEQRTKDVGKRLVDVATGGMASKAGEIAAMVEEAGGFVAVLRSVAGAAVALLGPELLLVGVIYAVIKAFDYLKGILYTFPMEVAKSLANQGYTFGQLQSSQFNMAVVPGSPLFNEFERRGITSSGFSSEEQGQFGQQVGQVQGGLASNLGGIDRLNTQLTGQAMELVRVYHLSTDEASKLVAQIQRVSHYSTTASEHTFDIVTNMMRSAKLAPADIIKDMAENTDTWARYAYRGADAFAKASINAHQLGISLGKIESLEDTLTNDFGETLKMQATLQAIVPGLDISRSIQAAFENNPNFAQIFQSDLQRGRVSAESLSGSNRPVGNLLAQTLRTPLSDLVNYASGKFTPLDKNKEIGKEQEAAENKIISSNLNLITALNNLTTALTGKTEDSFNLERKPTLPGKSPLSNWFGGISNYWNTHTFEDIRNSNWGINTSSVGSSMSPTILGNVSSVGPSSATAFNNMNKAVTQMVVNKTATVVPNAVVNTIGNQLSSTIDNKAPSGTPTDPVVIQSDNLEKKLDEMINLFGKGMVINMDGKKVGNGLIDAYSR